MNSTFMFPFDDELDKSYSVDQYLIFSKLDIISILKNVQAFKSIRSYTGVFIGGPSASAGFSSYTFPAVTVSKGDSITINYTQKI